MFLSANVSAQDIKIPTNLKLETKEDYKATEKLVLDCIEWIQNTPLSKFKSKKRKKIKAFLVQWMSGSPTVTIEISSDFIPIKSPEMLMLFRVC